MKVGILISAAIIILIAAVTIIGLRGVPDRTTGYSLPKMLEVKTLADLPPLVSIPSGDASAVYDEMFAHYDDKRAQLDVTDEVTATLSEETIDLIIKAHEAGSPPASYLDKLAPMTPRAQVRPGLQALAAVAITRADELHKKDSGKDRAEKTAKAVFAMGHAMFTKSNRVPVRTEGMAIMMAALESLYNWSGEGNEFADTVTKWTDAIQNLHKDYWSLKQEVVDSLKLNTTEVRATIGDLLEYAYKDKDLSWRIEATLSLGRVKYMIGRGKGNDRAIHTAIAKLKSDPEPKVAEAATVAEKYTRDDVKTSN